MTGEIFMDLILSSDPSKFFLKAFQQKEVLQREFDNGLQSSSKSNALKIYQLASTLGCTEKDQGFHI